MFDWFKRDASTAPGIASMTLEFGQMLDAGRHMFHSAATALLGGTDPDVIRKDLFATDTRINRAEMQIRREIVVHVSVKGTGNLSACLILMSVVKDAERIGDYAKNIFDLTVQSTELVKDAFHADLVELKDRITECLAETRKVFDSQDTDEARKVTRHLQAIEDHCDRKVAEVVAVQATHKNPVAIALCYRYFKRVTSHAMNISTSIFMPLDKIDYFDEEPRPAEPDGED